MVITNGASGYNQQYFRTFFIVLVWSHVVYLYYIIEHEGNGGYHHIDPDLYIVVPGPMHHAQLTLGVDVECEA